MAQPTTRAEFKEFCLRSLGKPVIDINVSDDQVDDRLDQSLRYYWDYHFDGTETVYYKKQIDIDLITNGYFELPENIIGAVRIFDISDSYSSSGSNLFNVRYQIALNDIFTLTNINLVGYYQSMQHLGLIQELLVGKTPIRYNRHRNRLYLDIDKQKLVEGQWIIVHAYEVVDPEVYPDVWADRWLQNYVTQQIKKQWGSNLTKFEGLQLPGGIQFNGNKIYDDAVEEIRRLEDEMINNYSIPVLDMIG